MRSTVQSQDIVIANGQWLSRTGLSVRLAQGFAGQAGAFGFRAACLLGFGADRVSSGEPKDTWNTCFDCSLGLASLGYDW